MERFIISDGTLDDTLILDGDFSSEHYYGLFNLMYEPFERKTVGIELDYGVESVEFTGTGNDIFVDETESRDAMRISFGFMFYL